MSPSQEYSRSQLRTLLSTKLPAGRYRVEYTDITHVPEDRWEPLLLVEVEPMDGQVAGLAPELTFPHYSVRDAVSATPQTPPEALASSPDEAATTEAPRPRKRAPSEATKPPKPHEEQTARKVRVLRDQLGQCLARCGLLRPEFAAEEARDLRHLSREQAVILLPDTNALFNGTLHWLTQSLEHTQLWIQPVAISLAQVQQRDTGLKSLVNNPKPNASPRQAVGSRAFVNATLGMLERLGQRYQVLEVVPELLRFMRPASMSASDPDQGDVLEDRLLLEAVHAAWRSTRSRAERRVVTSDVLFARILHAEGLTPLFLLPPSLPDESVPCMRFEPLSQRFEGAPLPFLLWDMAQTFSTIRLCYEDGRELARLSAYWPHKGVRDWTAERLLVTLQTIEVPATNGPMPHGSAVPSFSGAGVPEVSLVTVLNLAGKLSEQPGTLEELSERLEDHIRPGETTLRHAAEVLLRAGLADLQEGRLIATSALDDLAGSTNERGELDVEAADIVFNGLEQHYKGYEPYARLREALFRHGSLPLRDPPPELRSQLGTPSQKAYGRLIRYPVYLGQAYTDGTVIRNGSNPAELDDIVRVFPEVFASVEEQGLASVSKLLRGLCLKLSTSPWKLKPALARCAETGLLRDYAFEPAAAPQVENPPDSVLRGPLGALSQEPIPWEHVLIQERPVFTVRRRIRT